MYEDCLPPEVVALAARLAAVGRRHGLALGGGSACALWLGHRTSADLDLFALGKLDPSRLLADLGDVGERRLRGISTTEVAVVLGGIEFSATSLGRETLNEPAVWQGLSILSPLDLTELKADAAVIRGMVRDLCDLHLLCAEGGADLASAVRAGPHDLIVVLKALTDRARFEGQPALDLRRPWSLERAIGYFESRARELLG